VKEVLDHFELTDGRLLGITTSNTSSKYSITRKRHTTIEASGSEWSALRKHIPYMTHVIQLALGALISSRGVNGHTKSWEAHERDGQFGENESIHIGKSQRLRKEGNARINMVSVMRPGIATRFENVRISTYFESAESDLHIAENVCCIDYAETWSSKRLLDCQKAKVRIAVLPNIGVKPHWNSTLELLVHTYILPELTRKWLENPKHSDYRLLFTTQDKWTIAEYVMEM
jgi:hypothetical protein